MENYYLGPNKDGMGAGATVNNAPAAWVQLEKEGKDFSSTIQNLIFFIKEHYNTFPTIIPAVSMIKHDEVATSLHLSSNAFVTQLSIDSSDLTRLSDQDKSGAPREKSAKEIVVYYFNSYYKIMQYTQEFFKNVTKDINPYLTAVTNYSKDFCFEDAEAKNTFQERVNGIAELIQISQKSFNKIEQLMDSKALTCLQVLDTNYIEGSKEQLEEIAKIFQSKFDKPEFTDAVERLKVPAAEEKFEAFHDYELPLFVENPEYTSIFDAAPSLSLLDEEITAGAKLLLEVASGNKKRKPDPNSGGGEKKTSRMDKHL